MELLSIAQVLRHRRILVAVGVFAALVLGAKVMGVLSSRSAVAPAKGQARAQVLIDTRVPLAATTTPTGADTIVQRSVFIAALMGSDKMSAQIARRAGVPPDQLAVVGPAFNPVSVYTYLPDGELPQRAAAASEQAAVVQPFVVQLVNDTGDPIISVGTSAPDAREAAALATATVGTLEAASAAAGGAHSNLRAEPLGPVRSVAVRSGSGSHRLLGFGAAAAAFLAWCVGLVIVAGLGRMWRRTGYPATEGAG